MHTHYFYLINKLSWKASSLESSYLHYRLRISVLSPDAFSLSYSVFASINPMQDI